MLVFDTEVSVSLSLSFPESSDHEQQLYQLQSLIEQLPEVNRETLKRVIGHLTK